MRAVLAIARQEVRRLLATPVGWICICAFLLVTALFFLYALEVYNQASAELAFSALDQQELNVDDYLVSPFFGTVWVILLFVVPAITMGAIASDRATGALELLMTSPVGRGQVVVGKFLGTLGFCVLLLACTLHYTAILFWLGQPDPGVIACAWAANLLVAAALVSGGLFASSLTRSPVVALVGGFFLLMSFWMIGWLQLAPGSLLARLAEGLHLVGHAEDLGRGLVRLSDLAWFAGFVSFFLVATWQRLESLRWR